MSGKSPMFMTWYSGGSSEFKCLNSALQSMLSGSTTEHLAQFTIVPATTEQILVSRKRQSKTWARGMTEEEFIRREEMLEVQEHAKDNFTSWVLVPRDNTSTLDYPCSCETFRRKILVAKSGVVETRTGYGIASVFCAPEHRRKGYASHMMRLLHHVLASPSTLPEFPVVWGAPPPPSGARDAQLSVLYSDVGDFYAECGPSPTKPGWIVKDPISTVWKVDFITGIVSRSVDIPFEWLTEEKCNELWNLDDAYIKEEFSSSMAVTTVETPGFTFLPSDGVAGYLLQRVLAEAPLIPDNKEMKHFGVRMISKEKEPVSSPAVYATWTLDLELSERPVIVLTRLRSTTQYFPALMIQLMKEASRINAKSIEVWNLPSGLVDIATNMGGRTKPRVDHLPAVAWYGPEDVQNVKWVFNEKFAWC